MIEPQKKEIDGYTFTVSPLPGMRALKVSSRLAKLLGGALLGVQRAKSKDDQTGAAIALLGNLDDADVEFLARELLTTAVVRCPDGTGGNPVDLFDTLFQGKIDLLFKALFFAVQVNFPFVKGLGAVKKLTQAEASGAPESTSPNA